MYFQLFYLRKKVKHAFGHVKKDVMINLPLDSNLLMTSCKLAIMTRPSRAVRDKGEITLFATAYEIGICQCAAS